jgi:PhnB protein
MSTENNTTFFAPQLLINNGVTDISFYEKAFGATEHFCLRNDDNSVHVAELSISGAIFHLHEVTKPYFFSPEKHNGSTTIIGLFVENVQDVMSSAIRAGATEISATRDYEYGYRQGEIKDPFGHHWLIEKKI